MVYCFQAVKAWTRVAEAIRANAFPVANSSSVDARGFSPKAEREEEAIMRTFFTGG